MMAKFHIHMKNLLTPYMACMHIYAAALEVHMAAKLTSTVSFLESCQALSKKILGCIKASHAKIK
jgi:hypothetical protein